MLTLKAIMSQIWVGDWFVTVDLKDADVHIQVIRRHRKFLRFAFGGKVYQNMFLPFGLALAPRTFKKCMDAALAPFEVPGHSFTQLPGWLAHSGPLQGVSESSHWCCPLPYSCSWPQNEQQRGVFSPLLNEVSLVVHLDSVQMQARLAPARISSLNTRLARFKLDHHVSVSTCQRLLGLMPLGLPHMRPFLWWMKISGVRSTGPATRLVRYRAVAFVPF